ncbi:hypothetical protein SAMN04487770_12022 [Butyrivibrio sp. ob235]|uniref:hypothetical protein n=1 Tax=Butyrivibrio sp. ob235 TaxID=1761780 RepID=UPI0008B4888E|nr:hypothetical protein [Butyrivibrio sp. ob235]SEL89516.1 hypothetical protein SAMN04487770_12022 [Butyrivibrio sp. ob235]
MYEKIISLLQYGKENAIPKAILAARLGVTTREAQRIVNQARIAGYIILSDTEKGGYYLSKDIYEIKEFYRWMVKRQSTTSKVLKNVRKMLKESDNQCEGQLSFEDVENFNV